MHMSCYMLQSCEEAHAVSVIDPLGGVRTLLSPAAGDRQVDVMALKARYQELQDAHLEQVTSGLRPPAPCSDNAWCGQW